MYEVRAVEEGYLALFMQTGQPLFYHMAEKERFCEE